MVKGGSYHLCGVYCCHCHVWSRVNGRSYGGGKKSYKGCESWFSSRLEVFGVKKRCTGCNNKCQPPLQGLGKHL